MNRLELYGAVLREKEKREIKQTRTYLKTHTYSRWKKETTRTKYFNRTSFYQGGPDKRIDSTYPLQTTLNESRSWLMSVCVST